MKGVLFLDNTRMLQRNGRLTNLSAYNTVPRYNRSPLTRREVCGCEAQPYHANKNCGCNTGCNECGYTYTSNAHTNGLQLAISSIGVQKWCDLYELEQGFCAGTIFRQLDLPFCGMRGGH